MKIKSGVLRHLVAIADAWNITTGWIHAQDNCSFIVTNGTNWYLATIPGPCPAVDAQFQIDDIRKALVPLRGFSEVTLSTISLALGTRIIPLLPSTLSVPDILPEHQLSLDGHAWTSFLEKTKEFNAITLRDEYRGILFDGSGTTTALVATSGHSMYFYDTGIAGNGIRAVVPWTLCSNWQTLEQFTVMFSREHVVFKSENETLIGLIRPVIFPDYRPLLAIGEKSFDVRSEHLQFLRKIKPEIIDVRFHERDMVFEWRGPWGNIEQTGDEKVPATCNVTGLVSFYKDSLLPLLDTGELVLVTVDMETKRFTTAVGGFQYVFKGRD